MRTTIAVLLFLVTLGLVVRADPPIHRAASPSPTPRPDEGAREQATAVDQVEEKVDSITRLVQRQLEKEREENRCPWGWCGGSSQEGLNR